MGDSRLHIKLVLYYPHTQISYREGLAWEYNLVLEALSNLRYRLPKRDMYTLLESFCPPVLGLSVGEGGVLCVYYSRGLCVMTTPLLLSGSIL